MKRRHTLTMKIIFLMTDQYQLLRMNMPMSKRKLSRNKNSLLSVRIQRKVPERLLRTHILLKKEAGYQLNPLFHS